MTAKYKVKIIVEDENGSEIERNYNYEEEPIDFIKEVEDMVDSHLKSKI
jgi:hypothetical protein